MDKTLSELREIVAKLDKRIKELEADIMNDPPMELPRMKKLLEEKGFFDGQM